MSHTLSSSWTLLSPLPQVYATRAIVLCAKLSGTPDSLEEPGKAIEVELSFQVEKQRL